MGGRRAPDLTKLVGKAKGVSAAKRKLTAAVNQRDPKSIAEASVRLIASSQVGLQSLRYGLKLSPFISENRSKLTKASGSDRNEILRTAWSGIKSKERIRTSSEVDNAIISAASAVFRKGS